MLQQNCYQAVRTMPLPILTIVSNAAAKASAILSLHKLQILYQWVTQLWVVFHMHIPTTPVSCMLRLY